MTRILLAALLVLPALAGCVLPEADGLAASSIPRGFGPVFENATVEEDQTVETCPDCEYGDYDFVDVTAQRNGSEVQLHIQANRLRKDTQLVIAVQPISEGALPWHGHVNATVPRVNVTLDLPLIAGSAIVSTVSRWSGAMSIQSQEQIDVDEAGNIQVTELYRPTPFDGSLRMDGSRFTARTSIVDDIEIALSGDVLDGWFFRPRLDGPEIAVPTVEAVRGQASIEEATHSRPRTPAFAIQTIDIPLTLLVTFQPEDRPSECAQVTVDSEGFETIVRTKSTPCR